MAVLVGRARIFGCWVAVLVPGVRICEDIWVLGSSFSGRETVAAPVYMLATWGCCFEGPSGELSIVYVYPMRI